MAKRGRNDGRPKTVPLFTMTDPLPYTDGVKRFAVNFDGTLDFDARDGYSKDLADYA